MSDLIKKPLKVFAVNGSPRYRGNTHWMIETMFDVFKDKNIKTESIQIGKKITQGCLDCRSCYKTEKCVIEDDCVNECYQKIKESDGVIIASPVYVAGPSGQIKTFIDRVGIIAALNRDEKGHSPFYHKVGASIAVNRRGGAAGTFSQLNYFFTPLGFIIPGSTYWNLTVGYNKGDSKEDKEGKINIIDVAEEMSWLMNLIRQDKEKK
ncbi:flavodoxin family protein [Anaeramoeba ignava]|uniref:Flavodoxin family protein n=1 Tax=Anaeramoeba ignava TaxID=1746090 RepID=A0A9Q0LBR9_ANAIG|nr:flavodoxin family protein [Anaeramoeba ignava]